MEHLAEIVTPVFNSLNSLADCYFISVVVVKIFSQSHISIGFRYVGILSLSFILLPVEITAIALSGDFTSSFYSDDITGSFCDSYTDHPRDKGYMGQG